MFVSGDQYGVDEVGRIEIIISFLKPDNQAIFAVIGVNTDVMVLGGHGLAGLIDNFNEAVLRLKKFQPIFSVVGTLALGDFFGMSRALRNDGLGGPVTGEPTDTPGAIASSIAQDEIRWVDYQGTLVLLPAAGQTEEPGIGAAGVGVTEGPEEMIDAGEPPEGIATESAQDGVWVPLRTGKFCQ